MIFQYTLEAVLSGEKTATSRLKKNGETAEYGSNGQIEAVIHHGRDKYRVGKTYAVQPSRNASAVARIRLTSIRQRRVSEITKAEAKREGVDSPEAFFAQWNEIYGEGKLNTEVWFLTFELAPAE